MLIEHIQGASMRKRPFLGTFSAVKQLSAAQTSSKKVPPRGPKTLLKELEKLTADKAFLPRNPEVRTCRD
jgi:hypothetical protein